MKAIILAANDNPQLRPLTLRKLGALIKINGISLLERQIRGYSRAGVETASISVVSGYQHGQMKRCLMREHPEIRLVKNPDYRSGSALYSLDLALRSAEPHTADEGLFIRSGECVYDRAAIERVNASERRPLTCPLSLPRRVPRWHETPQAPRYAARR